MANNPVLTERVRAALVGVRRIEEKRMFSGITFMVNGKMCISVGAHRLMCRIDPALHAEVVERKGARGVKMRGHEYRGFVYVDDDLVKSKKELEYWVTLCLDFNKRAKSSKKKKRS